MKVILIAVGVVVVLAPIFAAIHTAWEVLRHEERCEGCYYFGSVSNHSPCHGCYDHERFLPVEGYDNG